MDAVSATIVVCHIALEFVLYKKVVYKKIVQNTFSDKVNAAF
jgi:hypothetical protein